MNSDSNSVFGISGLGEGMCSNECQFNLVVIVCFSNYFGVFALFFMTGLAVFLSYTPGFSALKLYPMM